MTMRPPVASACPHRAQRQGWALMGLPDLEHCQLSPLSSGCPLVPCSQGRREVDENSGRPFHRLAGKSWAGYITLCIFILFHR